MNVAKNTYPSVSGSTVYVASVDTASSDAFSHDTNVKPARGTACKTTSSPGCTSGVKIRELISPVDTPAIVAETVPCSMSSLS